MKGKDFAAQLTSSKTKACGTNDLAASSILANS